MKTLQDYSRFNDSLILRDYLALDRTILANERTLFSYIRLSLGLAAAGVGMIELLDIRAAVVSGCVLVAISPFVCVIGILRFIAMQKKLRTIATIQPPARDSENRRNVEGV
jgi:putative membrane protein